MPSNRNVKRAGTAPAAVRDRTIAYSPIEVVTAYIERELSTLDLTLQIARTHKDVIAALIDDPPPRPQILIADFDALTAGATLDLHVIRERGWFGAIVGLGTVNDALRSSLSIEQALAPPYQPGALRRAIAEIGLARLTTKMPPLER